MEKGNEDLIRMDSGLLYARERMKCLCKLCAMAKGTQILDISGQPEIDITMAKEGKKVTVIADEETASFLKARLYAESEEVQRNIFIVQNDFLLHDFANKKIRYGDCGQCT